MPDVAKDPRLASLTTGIRGEAMRLNNDIQNLLDAALITSQGLHSRRDWTDPTDIIDAAVERMRLRFPDRLVQLSLGSNLPFVHIDPVLVEQALSQIIANAAKFSNLPSTIEVSAAVERDELLISVHDDWPNRRREKQTLGKIFQRTASYWEDSRIGTGPVGRQHLHYKQWRKA